MSVTVFPTPQFSLDPDPLGPRMYANVDNRLEFVRGDVSFQVAVAVPAMLFSMMRGIFRTPPGETVNLSIDQQGNVYIFSIMWGEHLYDLWYWTERTLPRWMLNPERHLEVVDG